MREDTKGARTSRRILDVAEDLFGNQGYDGTSLRQIAQGAGIKEPGLYNHFAGKQSLYEAVLYRALNPMAEALAAHMEDASALHDYTELPAIMTDLLWAHPQMAALFQQAMQGDSNSIGNQLVGDWLERLFNQGMRGMEIIRARGSALREANASDHNNEAERDRAALAINLIAMFNVTTGYFLSQKAFSALAEGDLKSPENIAQQKHLLHKVVRAMLIN